MSGFVDVDHIAQVSYRAACKISYLVSQHEELQNVHHTSNVEAIKQEWQRHLSNLLVHSSFAPLLAEGALWACVDELENASRQKKWTYITQALKDGLGLMFMSHARALDNVQPPSETKLSLKETLPSLDNKKTPDPTDEVLRRYQARREEKGAKQSQEKKKKSGIPPLA